MTEWLQQIPQHSQLFVQTVAELLIRTVPMPWRAAITLLMMSLLINLVIWRFLPWIVRLLAQVLFGIVELIVSLLLLPEYVVTRQLRTYGWGPIWGSYLYGGLLGGIVRLFYAPLEGLNSWSQQRFPWLVFVLLAVLPVGLWHARPYVEGMDAATYVDAGVAWWYQLEAWLLREAA